MRSRQWIGVVAASLLTAAAGAAQAATREPHTCAEKTLDQAGAYLKIDDFQLQQNNGIVAAAACKRWPGKDGLMLGAFAYDGKRDGEKNLVIVVIDERKGKVVSAYRTVIEEDDTTRLEQGNLGLDTAAYDLAPGIRAFGVDIGSDYAPHCAQGGGGPERTLYVMEGSKIRPVMKGMTTKAWDFEDKESTTCSPDPAPVVFYVLSLAVDKASTNGYADLLVTAAGRYDDGKRTKREPFRYRMRYDGKQYPADMMMGAFWTWRN
jgi:hypothetical protein